MLFRCLKAELQKCRRSARQTQIVGICRKDFGKNPRNRRRIEITTARQGHQRRISLCRTPLPQPAVTQRLQHRHPTPAQKPQRQLLHQLLRHTAAEPRVEFGSRYGLRIGNRQSRHTEFTDILPIEKACKGVIRPHTGGDRANRGDAYPVIQSVAALAALHRLDDRAVHLAAQLS